MNLDHVQPFAVIAARQGYTQTTLAQTLGVGRPTVYYWVTGDHLPNARNLEDLEVLLGYPAHELFDPGRFPEVAA